MSDALLQYPKCWSNLLNLFKPCFTKPQFSNFSQATTCIAVSQHSTISRWCNLFDKKYQSSLNDFFTVSPWEDDSVHTRLSRLTINRFKDMGIGIIDDTLSHKPYASKMDWLGIFYDGLTKKKQKGHSIVTHGLHSSQFGFIPFDEQLYKKDGRSKNDIACTMIERTKRFKKLPLYVVDSWYSNTKVLSRVKLANSHYITEIKSNRNVTLSNKCRYAREHEKHIRQKDFKEVLIKDSKYRYFQTLSFISGLGNVNLVFSQKYDKGREEWGETYYLITDVLSLSGERVIGLFLVRGEIEGFHREAKDKLGLEDYQLRTDRGIERYLFLVLLVFVLLLMLNQQQMRNSLENKTIGELCRQLKAECYTTMLQRAKYVDKKYLEEFGKEMAYAL
ncbi:transposase [Candidatus Woesearchaeota archaeon]|nr:transposase [Candidatus Woesearchaeota archaeon]